MSLPVLLERSTRPPWRRLPAALLAVALARPLVKLAPRRLRQVLLTVRRGARPASVRRTLRARDAVVRVSLRCSGQHCLQRSVATALLCRLSGQWPDWCTGVRTEPFLAHAWVEAEGTPVGERQDMRLYHVTLRVGARSSRAPTHAAGVTVPWHEEGGSS